MSRTPAHLQSHAAFSLVELSIVLVILGLLTGGILSGQSLIRAAEIRSVSSDFTRYQTAVYSFRDKYFGLPGDITNADKFWGLATGGGGCPNATGTGTQTCNGNGDGLWYNTTGNYYEGVRAVQQLANAGLIEGSYTGVQATSAPYTAIGTNWPPSRITSAGFGFVSVGSTYGFSSGTATNMIWGTQTSSRAALFFGTLTTNDAPRSGILKPEEAWNIDTKLDDGDIDNGKLQGGPTGMGCSVATTSPADYDLTNSSKVCSLTFLMFPG